MKSYYSLTYVLFFLPLTLLLYQLTAKKYRHLILLGMSVLFYALFKVKLVVYLLITTLTIYIAALKIEELKVECKKAIKGLERSEKKKLKEAYKKKQRVFLVGSILLNLGMLIVLKYSSFIIGNVNLVCQTHFRELRFLVPIGISFYTLQAISYMVDVYQDTIKADRNLARLALFLVYFPQIMEGPICRYSQTAYQLYAGEPVTYESLTDGSKRMAVGLMKKLIVADRLNPLILEVFGHYQKYDGGIIFLGALCYTIQLYFEFSGSMDMTIGVSRMFNIKMIENFRQPFFSKNISEFWARWHISLGAFFKDYIYYPISMSHFSKNHLPMLRKKFGSYYGPLMIGTLALLCVWLCNGIWHGVGWSYIFFGMYHFFFILMGNIFKPFTRSIVEKCHIKEENKFYQIMLMSKTTIIVIIGEMFFRAYSLKDGLGMAKILFTSFSLKSVTSGIFLNLGVDCYDFYVVLIGIIFVLFMSVAYERKQDPYAMICDKPIIIRWTVYLCFLLFIVIFGAYGAGYMPIDPIYASF